MEYNNAPILNQQSSIDTTDTHKQLSSKRVIGVNSVVVSERELSVAEPETKSDFDTAVELPSKPDTPIQEPTSHKTAKHQPAPASPKISKQESTIKEPLVIKHEPKHEPTVIEPVEVEKAPATSERLVTPPVQEVQRV